MSFFKKKDKSKATISVEDIQKAGEDGKKVIKTALGVGIYNSEVDDEIGRSKEHAKHMRKTRRRNFARKMSLIDPNYGKKAAGVLAFGAVLGIAAATVPAVGPVLGPAVGGAVIGGGLAALETDAHLSVGDHAILDSLMEDRDDNWRTNQQLSGYNFNNDFEHSGGGFDWDEEDDDEFDDFVPEEWGGTQNLSKFEEMVSTNVEPNKNTNNNNNNNNNNEGNKAPEKTGNLHSMLFGDSSETVPEKKPVEEKKSVDLLSLDFGSSVPLSAPLQPSSQVTQLQSQLQTLSLSPSQPQMQPQNLQQIPSTSGQQIQFNGFPSQSNNSAQLNQPQSNTQLNSLLHPQFNPSQPQFQPSAIQTPSAPGQQIQFNGFPTISPQSNQTLQPQSNVQLNSLLQSQQPTNNLSAAKLPTGPGQQIQFNGFPTQNNNTANNNNNNNNNINFNFNSSQPNPANQFNSAPGQQIQFNGFPTQNNNTANNNNNVNFNSFNPSANNEIQFNLPTNKFAGNSSAPNVQRATNPHSSPAVQMAGNINKPVNTSNSNNNSKPILNNSNNKSNNDDDDDPFFELVSSTKAPKFGNSKYGTISTNDKDEKKTSSNLSQVKQTPPTSNTNLNTNNNFGNMNQSNVQFNNNNVNSSFNAFPSNNAQIANNNNTMMNNTNSNFNNNNNFNPNPAINNANSNDFFSNSLFSSATPVNNNNFNNNNNNLFGNTSFAPVSSNSAVDDFDAIFNRKQ